MALETKMNVSGSWETAVDVKANVSGTWRRCPEVWAKDGSNWELVFSDFAATIDDSTANAPVDALGTETVTITATGGSGVYAYDWAYVSGSLVPDVSDPTGAAVAWSAPDAGPYSAAWQCVVSDSYGREVTIGVNVIFFGPE